MRYWTENRRNKNKLRRIFKSNGLSVGTSYENSHSPEGYTGKKPQVVKQGKGRK